MQEAAIRINRRRIEALYREKKHMSKVKRPALFQEEDDPSNNSEVNVEAQAAIEQDKKIIHAIQQ